MKPCVKTAVSASRKVPKSIKGFFQSGVFVNQIAPGVALLGAVFGIVAEAASEKQKDLEMDKKIADAVEKYMEKHE